MDILSLIGRESPIFDQDLVIVTPLIDNLVSNGQFLVIGGAGSIGKAVTKELFKRDAKVLHVVDISENNLVELVREIRSTAGYGSGDFRNLCARLWRR